MKQSSTLILVGVGGAGCTIARWVVRDYGDDMRFVLVDTDAATGADGSPFVQLGHGRLAGHGAGGDVVAARLAAEDSVAMLDEHIGGVRLAVVVTALGGGTGSGATLEVVKHLASRGIASLVFATTPFSFEGAARHRNSRGMISLISESAGANFIIPLDKLVQGEERMESAMRKAVETLSGAISLFWRILETPGYISFDVEKLRRLMENAGRGRFFAASASGPHRAEELIDALSTAPLLVEGTSSVRTILCGVLAGEDLRLAEIAKISSGLRIAFGEKATFELATVNDEATFSSRICVVAMLLESPVQDEKQQKSKSGAKRRADRIAVLAPTQGRGRFASAEPTIWHGEDLDMPTYLRQNIALEF